MPLHAMQLLRSKVDQPTS